MTSIEIAGILVMAVAGIVQGIKTHAAFSFQWLSPIGPGSCVFLPRRQVHCVENTGSGPLRLVGVFYPAGSPAARLYRDASSSRNATPRK